MSTVTTSLDIAYSLPIACGSSAGPIGCETRQPGEPMIEFKRAKTLAVLAVAGAVALSLAPAAGAARSSAIRPSFAAAGNVVPPAPGVWGRVSGGKGGGTYEPGLLRLAGGYLLAAWTQQDGAKFSIYTQLFTRLGAPAHAPVRVLNWGGLEGQPRLLRLTDGTIRLVFNGNQDLNPANPLSQGARYVERSADGVTWSLVVGSLSSKTLNNLAIAATSDTAGSGIVSAAGEDASLWISSGLSGSIPSSTPDVEIKGPAGSGLENPALVRNSDGSIWISWYQRFQAGQGYYVKQIQPTPGPIRLAPGSAPIGGHDNEPLQQVALARRIGGGVYLAYCQTSAASDCARILLWHVGAAGVLVVPGSTLGRAKNVSLSSAPGGRLVVAWYDSTHNQVDAIRTNTSVTAFGVRRVIRPPSAVAQFDTQFAESSSGRIDVFANYIQGVTGFPLDFWHTQVLPGLAIGAAPARISHLKANAVTFVVSDAGQRVAGATVTFLGRKAVTNALGVAVFGVAQGQALGRFVATVAKADYFGAWAAVTVV
jgi:hypothetical protein